MDVRKDHKRLLDNLKLIQKTVGVKNLSSMLGINHNTWTNRMKEPWRMFSYDDFRAIAELARVDFTSLMEGSVSLK